MCNDGFCAMYEFGQYLTWFSAMLFIIDPLSLPGVRLRAFVYDH